jgi:hypothetical protein
MGIMDEIEDLSYTDESEIDEICEVCFADEYDHEDSCPFHPNNAFFDEEMEYSGGCE